MKEHEREKIEKMEKLISEAERSPVIKQLRETEAQETLAKRKAAAAKIADLTLDLEACRVIQREIDAMVEKLAVMDAEREKMKTSIKEKLSFMWQKKSGIEGAIKHEEEIVYTSYDGAIDEGIKFFRDKLDFLRSPGRISRIARGSERNLFTWQKTVKQEDNEAAILAALRYCQDAIKSHEQMKLLPELPLERIEELKKNVPKIDIYSEITGEKPLEKGHDASFLARQEAAMMARIESLLNKRV